MAKKLIVVESRAKTQSIGKIVGKQYEVTSCLGHIYDLPAKELGIDVDNGFKPSYQIAPGRGKLIKQLQADAKDAEEVILATDPDREGESIAWHLARLFPNKSITRMSFNEITPKAVREALGNLRTIDMNLVDAQQARRVMDRLVGYKVSPLLWRALNNSRLSAGRVQSVALRLICEREEEVEKFKPDEYWKITGTFKGRDAGAQDFEAVYFGSTDGAESKDEETKIENEAQASGLVETLKNCSYAVKDIKKRSEKRRPSAPFTTSTLQQESSRKLNFSASKTMMLAQQLYEGVDLGEAGSVGLITYMRTDSVRVSEDARADAAEYIKKNLGPDYLPEQPNMYKSKAGVQDAHEAIRPTSASLDPKNISKYLSKDQHKLYQLIWARFIASQMAPAVVDVTRYDIAGDDRHLFRATATVTSFDGFMRVYGLKSKEEKEGGDENGSPLPDLRVKEPLDLLKIDPKQHFTKPPSRYSEASLVRELEERGIGRPSTYVPIIETLKKRDYARLEKKSFKPTKWGVIVCKLLKENFADIVDYGFTARMEDELDKVENGKMDWTKLIGEFYGPFSKDIAKASKSMKFEEKVEDKCPECGSDLAVKTGRYGVFIGCSKYPECTYKRPYGEPEAKADAGSAAQTPAVEDKCEKCGSPMVVRTGRYGKFIACSGYPACKNIRKNVSAVKCPREGCDGKIVQRRSRNKRSFYGCSKYPECDFVTWSKPVEGKACPECGGLIVHAKSAGENIGKCINEKCAATVSLDERDSSEE
jgi:DNA topoisomerase-1